MAALILPIKNDNANYSGDIVSSNAYRNNSYTNKNAAEYVIRDIFRQRKDETEESKKQLIAVGAVGTRLSPNAEDIINDFKYVQNFYDIDCRGGRRIYHEILWLEPIEAVTLNANNKLMELAYACCYEFFNMGFQTAFAIHIKEGRVHYHFAVNAVSFLNGHKFSSYKNDLAMREIKINEMIKNMMNDCAINVS